MKKFSHEIEESSNMAVHDGPRIEEENSHFDMSHRHDFEKAANMEFSIDEIRDEEKKSIEATNNSGGKSIDCRKANQKLITFKLFNVNEIQEGEFIKSPDNQEEVNNTHNLQTRSKVMAKSRNFSRKLTYQIAQSKKIKEIMIKQKLIRFIDKLRSNAGRKNLKKCSPHSLGLINDLSFERKKDWIKDEKLEEDFSSLNERSSSIRMTKITLRKLYSLYINSFIAQKIKALFLTFGNFLWSFYEERVPTFKPMARLKLLWELMMLLLIFWHLNTLTLMISFEINPVQSYSFGLESFQNNDSFFIFQMLSTTLLSLDILIKFNTACYEGGSETYEKSIIVRKYAKEGFLFDCLGLLPHFVFFIIKESPDQGYYLKYYWLFIFKLMPLMRFFENINEGLLRFEGKKETVYRLIRLLGEVFIVCHLFACVWHYTALYNREGKNWIDFLKIADLGWEERYMRAIYYIVVTMTTTGYGDITPQSRPETLVSICCMFIGSVLVGYSINTIGSILETAQLDYNVVRRKLQMINSFMKRNNVNHDMQMKVRKYLQYIWGKNQEEDKKCQEILKELPTNFREEVLINIQGDFLKKSSILSKFFSKEALQKLATVMTPLHLSPGEWIFMEGDLDDECMYIVSSGSVEIVAHCEKKGFQNALPVHVLEKYSTFGEISFFTGCPREFSSRAKGFCTLIKINKDEFIDILRSEIMDLEMFYQIKDWILLDTGYKELGLQCLSCGNIEHPISKCPWISHQPSREIIIQRYLFTKSIPKRRFYKRKATKRKNALISIKILKAVSNNRFPCEVFVAVSGSELSEKKDSQQSLPENEALKLEDKISSPQFQESNSPPSSQLDSTPSGKKEPDGFESDENDLNRRHSKIFLSESKKRISEIQDKLYVETKNIRTFNHRSPSIKVDAIPQAQKKNTLKIKNVRESEKEIQEFPSPTEIKKNVKQRSIILFDRQLPISQQDMFYRDMDRINFFYYYSPNNNIDMVLSKFKYACSKTGRKISMPNEKQLFRLKAMKNLKFKVRESLGGHESPKRKSKYFF